MISEKLQSAIDLRASGRVQEAVQALQAIIDQPTDLDEKLGAQLNLVTAYVLLRSLPAARMVLQDASRLTSSRAEAQPYALYLEAWLLDEEGRIEELAAKFKQLLRDCGDVLRSPEHRELVKTLIKSSHIR